MLDRSLLSDLKGRHIFLALIYQLPTWSNLLRTEFHERVGQGLVPGAVASRILSLALLKGSTGIFLISFYIPNSKKMAFTHFCSTGD